MIMQISFMKPNVSELVQMSSYCLQQDLLPISGRAQVKDIISQIVAGRIDR